MTLAGPRFRIPSSLQIMRDPNATYARWEQQYGKTYCVRAVNGDVVVSSDTAVIRDLYKADDDQVGPFKPELFASFLGSHSLFALSGAAHRRERKLLMPPFHGARMRAYGEVIHRAASEAAASWRPGERRILSDEMLAVSLQVIAAAVFGASSDAEQRVWTQALRAYIDAFSPVTVFVPALQSRFFPPWRAFTAAHRSLDRMMLDTIRARRGQPPGDDIASMLVHATDEDGAALSDEAVRDELLTLLFAGHETTQISLAWALYQLHLHPEVLARLRDELAGVERSPAGFAAAPYLDAVVSETLRIDPIVPDILRTLSVPMTLGGLELPAGQHVAPLACRVHHDPELYPEPRRFRPERFIEGSFRPWEYLPFGGGTRRCIGAALATYEMKIVLGTLLTACTLELDGEDRMVRKTVTLGPARGVPMWVRSVSVGA